MSSKLYELMEEYSNYQLTNIHTAFPGVVSSYDSETRRAEIQPSLKRKLPNGKFMSLPVIVDVPIIFPGAVKCGIHFPLEEGDEVLVICSERSLDSWKDNGGDGIEDSDIRKFSLPDAIAIPGLQASEFPTIEDKESLAFHHDEKITVTNEDTTIEIEGENINIDNGKTKIKIEGDKVSIECGEVKIKNKTNNLVIDGNIDLSSSATGKVNIGNSIKTLGGALGDILDIISGMQIITPMGPGSIDPATIAKIPILKTLLGQVFD